MNLSSGWGFISMVAFLHKGTEYFPANSINMREMNDIFVIVLLHTATGKQRK